MVRAFLVWLAIIATESVQGALRRLLMADDLFARQIATLTGTLIVLAISYFTIKRLAPRNARGAFAIGTLWVVSTVSFDFALGRLTGASWERIWSDFNVVQGGLLPLGLAVMLVSPLIAMTMRGR